MIVFFTFELGKSLLGLRIALASWAGRVRACGGKGDGVRKRRPRLSNRWRRRLGNAMGRVRH